MSAAAKAAAIWCGTKFGGDVERNVRRPAKLRSAIVKELVRAAAASAVATVKRQSWNLASKITIFGGDLGFLTASPGADDDLDAPIPGAVRDYGFRLFAYFRSSKKSRK